MSKSGVRFFSLKAYLDKIGLLCGVAAAFQFWPVVSRGDLGPGLSRGALTIPDARLYNWTEAGVQGGVPQVQNSTDWPVIDTDHEAVGSCSPLTASEKADSASDKAKVQCYIDHATSLSGVGGRRGTVVKLGSGIFTVGAEPGIRLRNNVVLSGAGPTLTTIYRGVPGRNNCPGTAAGYNGVTIDYGARSLICMTGTSDAIPKSLALDNLKGQTLLTFTSDPGFGPSDYLFIKELDRDPTRIPVSGTTNIMQVLRLSPTSPASGLTRTLEKGSFTHFKTQYRATAYRLSMLTNAGVENLKVSWSPELTSSEIDHVDGIGIMYAANSWVSNVEVSNGDRALLHANITSHITVQESFFHNMAWTDEGHIDESSAIDNSFGNSENLYWNNRFTQVEATAYHHGHITRNVWAYNYSWNLMNQWRDSWTHGSYPEENLFEGNTGADNVKALSDDWWGGAFASTYFRNRYIGTGPISGMVHETWPKNSDGTGGRGEWAYSYENQILNVYRSMYSTPFCTPPNCFNWDGGSGGVAGSYLWAEKNRFTHLFVQSGRVNATVASSANVLPSTTYVDDSQACPNNSNFCRGAVGPTIDTAAGRITTGYTGLNPPASWQGQSFPPSLFLRAKPSWWCDELAWPAIGADVDDASSPQKLPAQRRAEGLPCTRSENPLSGRLSPPGQPKVGRGQ